MTKRVWTFQAPPNYGGGGNPWVVKDEDGETLAIIAVSKYGSGEQIARKIVRDHNSALSAQQPADLAPDPRDVEIAALRRALGRIGWHTEHGSSLAVIAAEVMVGLQVESIICPGCEHPKCLQASPERPAASEGDDDER